LKSADWEKLRLLITGRYVLEQLKAVEGVHSIISRSPRQEKIEQKKLNGQNICWDQVIHNTVRLNI